MSVEPKLGRTDKSDPAKVYAVVVKVEPPVLAVQDTLGEAVNLKSVYQKLMPKDKARIVAMPRELYLEDAKSTIYFMLEDLKETLIKIGESKETRHG